MYLSVVRVYVREHLLGDLYASGDAFYLAPTANLHTVPDRFDFIYFSFGTLTELGTQGITAVAPFARSTSFLEAILGVLYLAVLISRLINAYRSTEAEEGRRL